MVGKKIAVIFPGIGYTNDKPLLYYSRKLAEEHGYEVICTKYHDLPEKIRGNKEKMIQAGRMAFEQCEEILKDIDFTSYDEVLFIGKSIGTVMASQYAEKYVPIAGLVLYITKESGILCWGMRRFLQRKPHPEKMIMCITLDKQSALND